MKNKQNILITGASSGIGRSLSETYAKPQNHLILTGRNQEELLKTAESCEKKGATVSTHLFDMRDDNKIIDFLAKLEKSEPPSIVIANAGIVHSTENAQSFENIKDIEDLIDINLTACIKFTTRAADNFIKRESAGQIAIIASLSAIQPLNRAPTYSATKAGLVAFGEAFANIARTHGIAVSVICPGFVKSPMTESLDTWQPTKLASEKAAARIKYAIDRRLSFYAFPKSLYWSALAGRLLPQPLQRLSSRMFE